MAVIFAATVTYGLGPLLYVADHWTELITASLVMSIFQACFVHLRSQRKGEMLALGGNTNSGLYNVRPPSRSSDADEDRSGSSVVPSIRPSSRSTSSRLTSSAPG